MHSPFVMRSRWLLLVALGFGLSAAACGPDKDYCVSIHKVCTMEVAFDASTPDVQDEQMEAGVTVVNP
jgi:hypothetical protein